MRLIFRVDRLTGPQSKWRLWLCAQLREETPVIRRDLKAEPVLTVAVAQLDVTPGEIRDLHGGDDRFVGDVLHALEF